MDEDTGNIIFVGPAKQVLVQCDGHPSSYPECQSEEIKSVELPFLLAIVEIKKKTG